MGLLRTAVAIRNPADRTRSWQGNFLVDTGAIDTLVPRSQLEAIGLAPRRQRRPPDRADPDPGGDETEK